MQMVMTQEEITQAVLCHPVPRKRSLTGGASSRVRSLARSTTTTLSGRIWRIIYFGIDAMDPAAKTQIEALCDSGKIVHLYGPLFSNVPDYNRSQILVDRIEVEW
jgi:hypothetical protein